MVLFARLHVISCLSSSVTVSDLYQRFPQIDIIGAMVIVWRARGKITRSVLCRIVCTSCTQWTAHTYQQT